MLRHLAIVIGRSLALALLALALSMPLAHLFNHALGLGTPPGNGTMLLALGVVFTCLGAALVGAICGVVATAKSGPWRPFATLIGLAWGTGVALWLVPTYSTIVTEKLAISHQTVSWQKPDPIVPQGESATDAFYEKRGDENGQLKDANAPLVATPTYSMLGASGAARVPALIVLSWAIILAPLLAFWECRQARQLV